MSKLQGGRSLARIDDNSLWTGTTKYSTIYNMINTSPTITALLNAIKDPIRTAIWKINNPYGAQQEIVDYLKTNFFVKMNFYDFLETALHFLEYGYMPFEKEWVAEDSKYFLILHPRMPFTITQWNYDTKKGTILSAEQVTTSGSATIDFKNLFVITNNRQTLNPEGQSILRPLYRASVLSQEVEVAAADGLKKNLMGIPIAHIPESIDPDDEKEIKQFLMDVSSSPFAYGLEKGEVTIRFQGVEGTVADPEPFLNKLNSDVNNSQLANILSLSTSNRGSRAVGGTLAPPFYNRVAAISYSISHALDELIKEMVDLNFTTDVYPTIVPSGISAKDIVEKAYAIAALKDELSGVDLTQYLLDAFEIPVTVSEANSTPKDTNQPPVNGATPKGDNNPPQDKQGKVKK